MKMNGPGCVFDYYGRVPNTIYCPQHFQSHLEEAVYQNNTKTLLALVRDGQCPSANHKVGQMSCVEYTAMMGYSEILRILLEHSKHRSILQPYFALSDVVERAYMISKNKALFFGPDGALAEANRYEAAFFTAVEYNQPDCVRVLLDILGSKEPNKHNFILHSSKQENVSACELAAARGHTECYDILSRWRWNTPISSSPLPPSQPTRTQSDSERPE